MLHTEIFFEHERWGPALRRSAIFHIAVAVAIVVSAWIAHGRSGSNWGAGGGGSAMGVRLVSNVPLPANPVQTQNVLATESKGVSKSQPKPAVEEKEAIPIPEKNAKKKPVQQPSATQRKPPPEPVEEANNVVPFGEGGPVSGPYGIFSAGGAKGGFGFTGGGGDFGTRFAWYVRVVQQKVSENWLKYEVDPNISEARRVYLTFDITRDGRPGNPVVEQSSGVPSLDQSA